MVFAHADLYRRMSASVVFFAKNRYPPTDAVAVDLRRRDRFGNSLLVSDASQCVEVLGATGVMRKLDDSARCTCQSYNVTGIFLDHYVFVLSQGTIWKVIQTLRVFAGMHD
jgi:hypothetical protein